MFLTTGPKNHIHSYQAHLHFTELDWLFSTPNKMRIRYEVGSSKCFLGRTIQKWRLFALNHLDFSESLFY